MDRNLTKIEVEYRMILIRELNIRIGFCTNL